MDYQEALDIATDALIELKNHRVDVLAVTKPSDIQGAIELSKIISKLSPIIGNLLEYTIARHLNDLQEWPEGCQWIRQDPEFPDMVLKGLPGIQPGIEVKTWFPLATEITARFRDSQTHFAFNHTKVAMVCWMLESVVAGQPKIIDIWIGDAIEVAQARDSHYHNPPYYVVMEPEDTSSRTKNLQQTNCNGLRFQGTEKQLTEAKRFLASWGSDAKQYRPDREYQILLRQLIGRFPYRLDTNFGKMDRIVLSSLESFKTKVLTSPYYGRTILSWVKAIKLIDSKALAPLIDPTEPPPIH